MDNRGGNALRVPKRRGSGESDEHWLENLDMERTGPPEEEDPAALDGEDELTDEFEEQFEEEEEEGFRG